MPLKPLLKCKITKIAYKPLKLYMNLSASKSLK